MEASLVNKAMNSSCGPILRILGIVQSIPEAINIYLTAPCGYLAFFFFLPSDPKSAELRELMKGGKKVEERGETKQSLSSDGVTRQWR